MKLNFKLTDYVITKINYVPNYGAEFFFKETGEESFVVEEFLYNSITYKELNNLENKLYKIFKDQKIIILLNC